VVVRLLEHLELTDLVAGAEAVTEFQVLATLVVTAVPVSLL
jgi:hypothetical protein